MAALVDTNILVYCWDWRFPEKRAVAQESLRRGLAEGQVCLAHQAIMEFMAAVTRLQPDGRALLPREDACHETELLLAEFPILYPNAAVVRTALRGMAAYHLSWFDAHLWAYAESYGVAEILSEDFSHGQLYGATRARNPFVAHGLV